MKKIIAVALLLLASPTIAQALVPADPQAQVERTLGNLVIANINLNAQVQQARATIDELQKQLAAEKAKNAPPAPPAEPKKQ